jgi:hypothetical protein
MGRGLDPLHFYEDTAAKILRVPISRLGGEDFVSWPYTRFGVYTVRSAYNLARTGQFRLIAIRMDNKLWSNISCVDNKFDNL